MTNMPSTVRRSIELIGLFVLGMIINVGSGVLTPLILAFFLSILLLPIVRFFRKLKVNEGISIGLAVLVFLISIGLIIWFFSVQISRLVADFPSIQKNVLIHLNSLSEWINEKTDFTTQKQLDIINQQSNKLLNYAGGMLGGAAASLTSLFIFIGLMPIYIFLILFYKNLLLRFVFMWFPKEKHPNIEDTMKETQVIIKSYLFGLLIQITYITILLGGTLLIFGIKHALLIGVIFAILNLIPYVGALIGNLVGVLLTLSSSQELTPIITVLATIAVVQFLDNNILMPRILGSKVRINALASIVGVIVGGALAGISGMFLSLPIIAVLKVIFDRSDDFRQWGVLFGDERPKRSPMSFPVFRMKSKKIEHKDQEINQLQQHKENKDKE